MAAMEGHSQTGADVDRVHPYWQYTQLKVQTFRPAGRMFSPSDQPSRLEGTGP
jgi:hypothetical protein